MTQPKCYRVHIRKEALKFSAAHMTVFPDGSKEALHGHQYQTEVAIEFRDASLKKLVPFSVFKSAIKAICQSWDEKVLLPRICPFLEVIRETPIELEFRLCGKRYVLPADEVVFLQIENITAELLSEEFCRLLVQGLDSSVMELTDRIQVRIEESPGQGCTFTWITDPSSFHTRSSVQ